MSGEGKAGPPGGSSRAAFPPTNRGRGRFPGAIPGADRFPGPAGPGGPPPPFPGKMPEHLLNFWVTAFFSFLHCDSAGLRKSAVLLLRSRDLIQDTFYIEW